MTCKKCNYNDECSDRGCDDSLCKYCDLKNTTKCLDCVDPFMVFDSNMRCICPYGTFYDDKVKRCITCKGSFGRFCRNCNKETCLECIEPYCKYSSKDKACLCSIEIVNSCVQFNSFLDNIYYDYNCYCFNSIGECIIDCKTAYHPFSLACDIFYGYLIKNDYVEVTTELIPYIGCKENEYYNKSENKCDKCPDGCLVCNYNGYCLKDKDKILRFCPNPNDYVLNNYLGFCLDCNEFRSQTNKLICENNKVIDGSLCESKFHNHCTLCDDLTGCSQCDKGFYLDRGELLHFFDPSIISNSTVDNINISNNTNIELNDPNEIKNKVVKVDLLKLENAHLALILINIALFAALIDVLNVNYLTKSTTLGLVR
jgi:hypothetical protein